MTEPAPERGGPISMKGKTPHWESRRDRRDPAITYRWRDRSTGIETLQRMDHHEAGMYEQEHGLHLEPIEETEGIRFFDLDEPPAYYD